MAFVNIRNEATRSSSTEDRERGYVLRCMGGPRPESGDYLFELEIEGHKVKFQGPSGMEIYQTPSPEHPEIKMKYNMNWFFRILSIPPEISLSKPEIRQIIKEALEEWGDNYRRDGAHIVTINYNSKLL